MLLGGDKCILTSVIIFQTHFRLNLARCGRFIWVVFANVCKWSGANAKMWLWVMTVVVKTLKHHRTSISMSSQKIIFQILDHAKKNMMGNIVANKVI